MPRIAPLVLLVLFVSGCAARRPTPAGVGSIALDTTDPKYHGYFSQVRERIRSKWVYPREAAEGGVEGHVRIEFQITKDGRLSYIQLRESSGTRILDDAAMTAVKLAQPFPPVPDTITTREALSIRGTFRYRIRTD